MTPRLIENPSAGALPQSSVCARESRDLARASSATGKSTQSPDATARAGVSTKGGRADGREQAKRRVAVICVVLDERHQGLFCMMFNLEDPDGHPCCFFSSRAGGTGVLR